MTDVPYGRGGSPLQHLILAGHRETKVSALRMVEAFDAGPVYLKAPMDLTTAFDDIATHPDDLPAGKPEHESKKKDRAKIKAAVQALEAQRK